MVSILDLQDAPTRTYWTSLFRLCIRSSFAAQLQYSGHTKVCSGPWFHPDAEGNPYETIRAAVQRDEKGGGKCLEAGHKHNFHPEERVSSS